MALSSKIDDAFMKAIREKWDSADRQSPTIPTKIYERIEALIRSKVDKSKVDGNSN